MKTRNGVRFIPVIIHGMSIYAMVDSGSSINCVGPSLFQKIPWLTKEIIKIADTALSINNEIIKFYGILNLEITLGNSLMPIKTQVSVSEDLPYQMIIGLPLLEQVKATLDFASNVISIPHQISVSIDNEMQIPINASNIVQACIQKSYPIEILGYISLDDHLTTNCPGLSITIPKIKILPGHASFQVQLQNAGEQPLVLKKGNNFGKLKILYNTESEDQVLKLSQDSQIVSHNTQSTQTREIQSTINSTENENKNKLIIKFNK